MSFDGGFLTGLGRGFGLGASRTSSDSVSDSGGGAFFFDGGGFEGPSPTSGFVFRVDLGFGDGGGDGAWSPTENSISGIVTGLCCNSRQGTLVYELNEDLPDVLVQPCCES